MHHKNNRSFFPSNKKEMFLLNTTYNLFFQSPEFDSYQSSAITLHYSPNTTLNADCNSIPLSNISSQELVPPLPLQGTVAQFSSNSQL